MTALGERMLRIVVWGLVVSVAFGICLALASNPVWADEFVLQDSSGQSVHHARVRILDNEDRWVSTGYADGLGRFVIANLRNGVYWAELDGTKSRITIDGGPEMKAVRLAP